jgi:ABC-2 type transport system ATP-binding protein
MSPAAIETVGLSKIYRSGFFRLPFVGLEPLDLAVLQGEIFGFVGPNGAGKTTLLKCLVGLQEPTAGRASILGVDIRDPEARRRVGFLPERPYFYQHLTAAEFLEFQASLFGIARPGRRRRCRELLAQVELEPFADVQLGAFSKGMLQRVGVAQALVNDPDVVIFDEPMSGLDPMGRMLVRDLILDQHRRGRTVFFSSHILSDVQSICDRVGLIVGGELRKIGRVDDLLGQQVLYVDCTVVVPEAFPDRGTSLARNGLERVIRLDPTAIDAFLGEVLEAKGQVLQVQPARETLEKLLFEEVRGKRLGDQKHLGVLE